MSVQRVNPSDLIDCVFFHRLRGCEASQQLRTMVHSREVDWESVLGRTSAHIVLPAFAAALQDLDLIRSLDKELGDFLAAVHAANMERNQELRNELRAAVDILNRAGIHPVLLKGAIRLVDGLYPDDGWRMLRDLDLLVPEAALGRAIEAFEEAGYTRCGLHNEVRRRDGACQIDLHTEVFSGSTQLRLMRAESIRRKSRPITFKDGQVRIPSIEHQISHLIGHSQIRHRGYAAGRIGLNDLLEIAALMHWGRKSIDWPMVFRDFFAAGYKRPLLTFLLCSNDRAWCTVPMGRIDLLIALQRRRIALQTRSSVAGHIGAVAGWWLSEFKSQVTDRDGGQLRVARNLKRLFSEQGALRQMMQSLANRQHHLVHTVLPNGWFFFQ